MILAGHQPNYLPYAGLIGKIMMANKFIYVTKIQFDRKSWQNRNKIKTANGCIWLTVPTLKKGKFDQNICDVEIDNTVNWRKKHFSSINISYKHSKYYKNYIDFFDDLYSREWNNLTDLDIYIMNFILKELNISTEILYDKDFCFSGHKTELLVNMCKQTHCDTYLSNKGSENYVELDVFTNNELNHIYMNYIGKQYKQQFYNFEPNLSIIDMLFNCGKEDTRNLLADQNNYEISELNKKI